MIQKDLHLAMRFSHLLSWFIVLHHEKRWIFLTHSHYFTCQHGIFRKTNDRIQIDDAHPDDLITDHVLVPQLHSHRPSIRLEATVDDKLKRLIKKIIPTSFLMNVSAIFLV